MSRRITYLPWSIELLPHWTLTEHPECITLEGDFDGALQFSSATKKDGEVTEEFLSQCAESRNSGWGTPVHAICGEFTGLLFRYADGHMQCNRWFLRNKNTLLFATYFGSRRAQLMEYSEVERTLGTLRAETAA